MTEKFSAEFYINNRARLRTLFKGTAPIVITAHGLLQQGGDSTYRFHQDGSFLYLTGISAPDIILVIDKDKEYIVLPERTHVSETFDGVNDLVEFTKTSGIVEVLDSKTGWKKLSSRLKRVKHVATLAPLPEYVDVFGFYSNPSRTALMNRVKEINPTIEPLDLRQHLSVMRMVKQAPEIVAIQSAIDITIASFKDVKKKLPKLTYEYEVEAIFNAGFRGRGADGHAFSATIASGKNACILHNESTNQPLQQDGLLLMDVGAEVHRYAADITRTINVGKEPTKRQQNVFEAVCEVQDYAFELLKPGVTIRDNEKLIEQFMGEKLRSLGLIRNVESEEIRRFFPHATSHFLGLDVHDTGDYERPLEPGVVLTVEPGIYISEEGIGVRIEDDVLITETGCEILSKRLPRVL